MTSAAIRLGGGTHHALGIGGVIVGRHPDVGLVLADDHVSSHHAELYWDGERLRVRDLGSRNGTFVDGRPIGDGWVELVDGNTIRFGTVDAVVDVAAGPFPPTSPPTSPPFPPPAAARPAPSAAPVATASAPPGGARGRSVFISHSSDDKRHVRMIAEHLQRRGWSVWVDEADIAGGEAWRASLMRALENSWIVLLVVSRSSMTSKWVMREMDAADRLGLRVIPVVIESVPYPDELRMMLSGVQQLDATDLFDQERRSGQLARIDDALVTAARSRLPGRPGRIRIVLGSMIMTIGVLGIVVGFAGFGWSLYEGINDVPEDEMLSPFLGWALAAASMFVTAFGAGIRQWGRRSGI